MIDFKQIEKTIVNGLQNWITGKGNKCPVIMANQTSPIPPYPYISYTVTTPVMSNTGTYSVGDKGVRYKTLTQVWSFTVQSDDDVEAVNIALTAYDWFDLCGNTYLSDNNIIVQNVGNINNRDNLISIEYEHRQGFDVTFALTNEISKRDSEQAGYIETATIRRR